MTTDTKRLRELALAAREQSPLTKKPWHVDGRTVWRGD